MDYAFYRQFDRIVLLVRDPRDIQVSRVPYRAYGARALHADPGKLREYVDLLRAKEAQPRSVSLTRIDTLFVTEGGSALHSPAGIARMLEQAMAFHDAFVQSFVFHYKDMVAGRFDTLAQHLSLPVDAMGRRCRMRTVASAAPFAPGTGATGSVRRTWSSSVPCCRRT
jgi:hypothetical protein